MKTDFGYHVIKVEDKRDAPPPPFDQVQEQLRLLIEKVKERQDGELINNGEYGLLASVALVQRALHVDHRDAQIGRRDGPRRAGRDHERQNDGPPTESH